MNTAILSADERADLKLAEKAKKFPHLVDAKRIKVQALRDGYIGSRKVIEGEVFVLNEKVGLKRVSKFSDYTRKTVVSVLQQFSEFWMVEIEEGNEEEQILSNEQLKEERAKADLLRARESDEHAASLKNKPVVAKVQPAPDDTKEAPESAKDKRNRLKREKTAAAAAKKAEDAAKENEPAKGDSADVI